MMREIAGVVGAGRAGGGEKAKREGVARTCHHMAFAHTAKPGQIARITRRPLRAPIVPDRCPATTMGPSSGARCDRARAVGRGEAWGRRFVPGATMARGASDAFWSRGAKVAKYGHVRGGGASSPQAARSDVSANQAPAASPSNVRGRQQGPHASCEQANNHSDSEQLREI